MMPTHAEIIKAMAASDKSVARAKVPANFKVSTDFQLEQTLQQRGSGWSSDHRKEAEMYTGWNYVAIHAIATQCGQAACYAYSEADALESVVKSAYNDKDDQGRPLPKGSALLKFLRRPNPQQSGSSFRFEMALQLKLTGKVLIWNMTNKYGKVVRRYIIPTAIAEPRQPDKDFPEGHYRIKPELARQGGQQGWFFAGQHMTALGYQLDSRHVQVILDPHPVYRDDGQSSVAAGALWTDSSNHIDTARTNHMRLGPDPSVHVHIAGQMDTNELKGAESRFNQKYCGTDKAGRAMFTSGDGVSVTPLSHNARDMAYGEGFTQMRDAIMALHKVPPTAAGIEQATGGESLYAPLKQFIFLTIQPILNLLADEDNENWVWQYGEGHYVEYRAKAIDEPEQRNRENEILMKAGAITKGELRLRMGMEIFGDERDDELAGESQKAQDPMAEMMGGTPPAMGMDGEDSVANPPPQFFGAQDQQPPQEGEEQEAQLPEGEQPEGEEQQAQSENGDFTPEEQESLDQMAEAEALEAEDDEDEKFNRLQKSLDYLISEFKAEPKQDTCGAGSPGGKGFAQGNSCQSQGGGDRVLARGQTHFPEEDPEGDPKYSNKLSAELFALAKDGDKGAVAELIRKKEQTSHPKLEEKYADMLKELGHEQPVKPSASKPSKPSKRKKQSAPRYPASMGKEERSVREWARKQPRSEYADELITRSVKNDDGSWKVVEVAPGERYKPPKKQKNQSQERRDELVARRKLMAQNVNFDDASPAWKELAIKEGWHEEKSLKTEENEKWEHEEKAILGLSNQASLVPSQDQLESESEWVSWTGPRGGKGWRNTKTGKIVKGKVRPDERRRRPSDGRTS